MSLPQPKAPEVIQAQVATFATEHMAMREDHKDVMSQLSQSALEPTVEYTQFLREVGGMHYEGIQQRAKLLLAYPKFKPAVDQLMVGLNTPATQTGRADYLGTGSSSSAFSIEVDGKKYAVRVGNQRAQAHAIGVDDRLATAEHTNGVPHLEQFVAGSYEDGVAISELMPGKEVNKMSSDEMQAITDDQLDTWVDTVLKAHSQGLELDPKPNNYFYDPQQGFGIVDLRSIKQKSRKTEEQNAGQVVGWMAAVISNAGFHEREHKFIRSLQDYADDKDHHAANLKVLNRYRRIVDSKLEGEDKEAALAEIDRRIEGVQDSIKFLGDPEKVAESMRLGEAARAAQIARNNQPPKPKGSQIQTELDLV